jgi:hypothetical protein
MKKYFEIVNLAIPCVFLLQDGTRFDLRTGIPNNSLEVFKQGFHHLGLVPGAEELFKKESNTTVASLIQSAKSIQDVEILALAKPNSKTIQELAKAKIEELK